MKYYVVGGEYLDIEHEHLKPGAREQYGPYEDFEAAVPKWRERAWATLDDYYCLFKIVSEVELTAPQYQYAA